MLWWNLRQLTSKNVATRMQATKKLVASKSPKITRQLVAMLLARQEDVRRAAAEALGEIGDASAVDALIAAMRDERRLVRCSAGKALGRIGSARPLDSLVSALEDKDFLVRCEALRALEKIGDRRAISPIITALNDHNYLVRESAANALRKLEWAPSTPSEKVSFFVALRDWNMAVMFGDVAAGPLSIALKDSNEEVQKEAAKALAKLSIDWKGTQLAQDAIPHLIEYLTRGSETDRERAARELARIGAPAINPIFDMLEQARGAVFDRTQPLSYEKAQQVYNQIRQDAVKTLSGMGEPIVETLIAALNRNQGLDLRNVAIEVLGQIGDGRAGPLLLRWLNDDYTREVTAEALARIGDASIEPLVAMLVGEDYGLRQEAAKVLQRMNWDPSTPRESAFYKVALKKWDELDNLGREAVEPLTDAIEVEQDWQVCLKIVKALATTGDARAVDGLIVALKQDEKETERVAIQAMQNLDDGRAARLLSDALTKESQIALIPEKDPYYSHSNMCYKLMTAIGKMGDASAIRPLLTLTHHEGRADDAISTLGEVLRRAARNAAPEELREIVKLEGISQSRLVDNLPDENYIVHTTRYEEVDISEIKGLAVAELTRRGLSPKEGGKKTPTRIN